MLCKVYLDSIDIWWASVVPTTPHPLHPAPCITQIQTFLAATIITTTACAGELHTPAAVAATTADAVPYRWDWTATNRLRSTHLTGRWDAKGGIVDIQNIGRGSCEGQVRGHSCPTDHWTPRHAASIREMANGKKILWKVRSVKINIKNGNCQI